MAKLHELIAIEKDRKKTTQAIIGETQQTLHGKKNHFEGSIKKFEPVVDGAPVMYEDEVSYVVTSVEDKLDYFNPYITNMMDIIFQKETSNCEAKADIVIDGEEWIESETIMSNVPVQALVQYEKLLEQAKGVYLLIPTNDPKHQWSKDESRGAGFWKTGETKRHKTKKVVRHDVIVQPTDKFPAQVAQSTVDEVEGHWVETKFSGMMSPAEKSKLLARTEQIIEAVKKARSRANLTSVTGSRVAHAIFNYIKG